MDKKTQSGEIGDYYTLINAIIVAINIIIFLFVDLTHSSDNIEWMLKCGALYIPYVLEKGEVYRFISSMFLHFGIAHLFNNMLILWILGGMLENLMGHIRYVLLYFISGILAGIASIGYNIFIGETPVCAGASGAVFGVIGALFYVVLIHRGQVQGLSGRQMIILVFLSLYGGFTRQGIDNAAHVGGFIGGFLLAVILYRKPKSIFNATN